MQDFKKFEVSYNGHTYISEFDFESIKRADELKVMELGSSPISFTAEVFYCSVLKHQPNVSRRKIREFFDSVIQDEEYGLSAFDDIVEEFMQHFLEYAAPGRQKKKKRFTASESPKVQNIPQSVK